MQTVETVLQIDKTVKQTDESEFNFFYFKLKKTLCSRTPMELSTQWSARCIDHANTVLPFMFHCYLELSMKHTK